MSFGRRFIAWFLSAVLAVLLFTLAIDVGFSHIAGQPNTIESVLDKSGVYNSVVPGLLDEAKTIQSSSGDIPLSDPIVRSAATSTLTPQYLRTNTNQALDSIYQWLNGKISQPQFNFNLTDVKNKFADQVAAGVKQKAASLPACTPLDSGTFNAFTTTCLPAGLSPDQAADQARSSILSGQGFLDNTNVTASDLKANGSNRSVFADQLKDLPNGYQHFKQSSVILGLMAVVFAALVVLVYEPRLKGLRHVGFVVGGVGFFVVMFGLGLNAATDNKLISNITLNNATLQADVRSIVRDIVHSLSGTYIWIGAIYLLLGAVGVGIYYYMMRQPPTEPAAEPVVAEAGPKPKAKRTKTK